jgi:hypothetical protein
MSMLHYVGGLRMAESAETKEYMGRSWRMLTHDKGWYKPLLVLPLAKLVPIAGPLGVWGYQAEWARLSAWGKETYPKQSGVKVGACIKSGWRAFLAMLGYAAVYFILLAAVRPSADGLAALLWNFVAILWSTIAWVAAIRATIYQHARAGYQLDRIWDMLKRDFGSIAEIALVLFLGSLLIEGFCILCAPHHRRAVSGRAGAVSLPTQAPLPPSRFWRPTSLPASRPGWCLCSIWQLSSPQRSRL